MLVSVRVSVVHPRLNPHPTRLALASVLALVSLMPVLLAPARTKPRPRTVLHREVSVVLVMLSVQLIPIRMVSCLAVNSKQLVFRLDLDRFYLN